MLPSARVVWLLAALTLAKAFSVSNSPRHSAHICRAPVPVLAAKSKKKPSKGKKASAGFGAKKSGGGFGAAVQKEEVVSPEQSKWLKFMDWVAAAGGSVDAVKLANCGGGLRGTKAQRSLKRGDEVLRIPRDIILDETRAGPGAVLWRKSVSRVGLSLGRELCEVSAAYPHHRSPGLEASVSRTLWKRTVRRR